MWLGQPPARPEALLPPAGPGQCGRARAPGLTAGFPPRLLLELLQPPTGEVTSDQDLSLSFLFCTIGTMTDCASEVLLGIRHDDVCPALGGAIRGVLRVLVGPSHLLHEDAVPWADPGSAASPDPEAHGLPALPSLGTRSATIPGGDTVLAATSEGEACWCCVQGARMSWGCPVALWALRCRGRGSWPHLAPDPSATPEGRGNTWPLASPRQQWGRG